MRPLAALSNTWDMQRGSLFLWVPVCLAYGIGWYFSLRFEPDVWVLGQGAGVGVLALAMALWGSRRLAPLWIGLCLVLVGFALASARSHAVSAPVLTFRYYGPIEGRIVKIDRSSSDAVRLTLDQVRLDRMAPDRTPARVRVSLHSKYVGVTPEPGLHVMTTGHLSPPAGPAEPGGFDFQRNAWFERLGAVGYTRNPVLTIAPARQTTGLRLARLRGAVSARVRDSVEGDAGGFAAVVMTGDRSGLSPVATETMRAANLYHLVSISGMHMGMLAGFVFGAVRYGVAFIPYLALRLSARKIAVAVALPTAAFYLALAGRAIPTERAFVMIAVMLIAILFDRRALSLRAVAIAATVVLVLRPESLVNPGFQMSFSAVVALVFVFGHFGMPGRRKHWALRMLISAAVLTASSFVAGAATAPFAAAHFNRIAHYGVIANFFAVPVMGIVVMPAAVMYALLEPIGLGWIALAIVEAGAKWILWIAQTVAGWDGAMSAVVQPQAIVLPLLGFGGCALVIWVGRGKWFAAIPVVSALAIWSQAERPAMLIADSGGIIGLATPEGRALSRPTGNAFVAGVWIENDGDLLTQEQAAALGGFTGPDRLRHARVGPLSVLHVSGTRALAQISACDGADILVSSTEITDDRGCLVFDPIVMRPTGAVAIWMGQEGPYIETSAQISGRRLWHGRRERHLDPPRLLP